MDAVELLERLGHVEPPDQAVLDNALHRLERATSLEARRGTAQARADMRRIWLAGTAAVIAACVAVSLAVAVSRLDGAAERSGATGFRPSAQHRPDTSPVAPSHGPRPAQATLAAVLTAVRGTGNDVLKVTKVVRGEGTCCRSIIWASPAAPATGSTVTTKIQNFTLAGARLDDVRLSYTAPATSPARRAVSCAAVFGRPKIASSIAGGLAGMLTDVNYQARVWARAAVRVRAATLPTASGLRACIRGGQWRVVRAAGPAQGKPIELVSADGTGWLWVSAATLLPERMVFRTATPYGNVTIRFGFSFLPPSAAAQALRPPSIPAGYARVHL